MKASHIIAALISACTLALLPVSASGEPAEGDLADRFLHLHNAERVREHLPVLQWNPELAKDADVWARRLAKEGKMRHSPWKHREGTGENLWMGTAGFFTPEAMIRRFTDEKENFRPGTFPEVSKTGKWQDVAHYTQMIWPSTEQVGCAIARGKGYEFLVCRYWPSGNYFGSGVG